MELKYILRSRRISDYIKELSLEWFDDEHFDELKNSINDKELFDLVCLIKSLPNDKTYTKLINYMETNIDPLIYLDIAFDYPTAKMILEQSEKYNTPLSMGNNRLLYFLRLTDTEAIEGLFKDENYDEEKISEITDPMIYHRLVKRFTNQLDLNKLHELRRNFINNNLSVKCETPREFFLYDEEYYRDKKKEEDSIKEYYLDTISEYFFGDIYNNAYIDVLQIIKYIIKAEIDTIPLDRINFYNEFIHLNEKEIIGMYLFFLKNDYLDLKETIKNDFALLKKDSYKRLVDSTTKFDKTSPFYDKEQSDIYGVDIYYLDGGEFYGFVRSNVRVPKYEVDFENGIPKKKELAQPSKEEINRLASSFTYIGKENIQTYKNPNECLTLLYEGVTPEDIVHVYHDDSWSSGTYSSYSNELHTPSSLLTEASKYPEINIANLEHLKPCGIICLDEPTPWDIKFSKENNIPIIVLNTNKYERKYNQSTEEELHYK